MDPYRISIAPQTGPWSLARRLQGAARNAPDAVGGAQGKEKELQGVSIFPSKHVNKKLQGVS